MDFIQVIHALKTIRSQCLENSNCECCRLHSKDDVNKCGVCPDGRIPARWDFDLESEECVPSIFK